MLNAILLVCAMAAQDPSLLISTDVMAIEAASSDIHIVDLRKAEAYEAGHIPGARRIDVESLSEVRNDVEGLLRDPNDVAHILNRAGVTPTRPVVIYSGMENSTDIVPATRLFWILEYLNYPQVSILDGGYARWKAEGRAIETGPAPEATLPENPSPPQVRRDRLATREDVKGLVNGAGLLMDNRPPGFFSGERVSGAVAKGGHIPGAVNAPVDEFIDEATKTVKPLDEIKAIVQGVGITDSTPVVSYCNTGRSASVGYFIGRLTGVEHVALYDGSMAEWSRDPTLPVESSVTETPPDGASK